MSESPESKSKQADDSSAVVAPAVGPVSQWLTQQGFDHDVLEPDHVGIEQIGVEAAVLPIIAAALKGNGLITSRCRAVTTKALANGWFVSITSWRWLSR